MRPVWKWRWADRAWPGLTRVWQDPIFRTAFGNTVLYTIWATMLKLSIGMWVGCC